VSAVDIEGRVRALLSELLQVDASSGEMRRKDVAAWDSLKHVDLIFLIEEEFDVILAEDDMAEADSVSAIVDLVRRRAS